VSQVWDDGLRPAPVRIGPLGWLLAVPRGLLLIVVLLVGLGLMLLLRLIEKPLFAPRRPVTPWITEAVSSTALVILGIRLTTSGEALAGGGALVANHASWLDIFVLNARRRLYFVAKDEVASWPGISWLAKATGTVFIRRDRREAGAQVALFRARLAAGHRLLFFPEGTSTDSRRVLPFKTTLFAAFFAEGLREGLKVQPVTVLYHAPKGADARFYGWWGDMDLGPHLLKVLASPRPGRVEVIYHSPVAVADFADRKALAAHCEAAVRAPLDLMIAGGA